MWGWFPQVTWFVPSASTPLPVVTVPDSHTHGISHFVWVHQKQRDGSSNPVPPRKEGDERLPTPAGLSPAKLPGLTYHEHGYLYLLDKLCIIHKMTKADRSWKTRNTKLEQLGMTYQQYLASDHWADVKARYKRSKLPQNCYVCGKQPVELHHRTYKRLGEEKLMDIVPLCRTCHQGTHDRSKETGDSLWEATRRFRRSHSVYKSQRRKSRRTRQRKRKASPPLRDERFEADGSTPPTPRDAGS